MATSLKGQNHGWLLVVILANFVVLYLAVKTGSLFSDGLGVLVRDWKDALLAGGAILLTTLLNGLLSRDNKARIVFWKWNNPLPSRAAFSRHGKDDQRVDLCAIEKRFGTLPTSPEKQSALWYKIYSEYRDDPAVLQVHRDYLLMRDWCSLSVLFIFILGTIGVTMITPLEVKMLYTALLIGQYVLTMLSARNYGVSLVKNTLALGSTAPPQRA